MWHSKKVDAVCKELFSSPKGLTTSEAAERLLKHGPNELKAKAAKTPLAMIFDQFKDFMIIVLLIAALISGFIGEATDTIAIIVIVALNAVIGFVQEYRAEKSIAALKSMAAPSATVFRDGHRVAIPAADLVPGDAVILEAGAIIPADLRLIEAARLKIDEATLTGESVPVDKTADSIVAADSPLGDRHNMAFKGTFVTYGRGVGIVTATGHATELGMIADMIQGEEGVKTPLQKRLASFGRNLAVIVLVISAIVFVMGLLRGEDPGLMLLTAISLAVAAIPEALPALVTIALAIGARHLVKNNALIRTLPAVETLGSVTYICTDKTGTLTMNKMQAEEFLVDGTVYKAAAPPAAESPAHITAFMEAMALCNDASRDGGGGLLGDPTETALLELAEQYGLKRPNLEEIYPRLEEIPFDSDRKRMTTIHAWKQKKAVSFTKGAVEAVLERADYSLGKEGIKPIDREVWAETADRLSSEGLRVLAVGMRLWETAPDDANIDTVETGLTLLGLVGIMDPPREEAKEAVAVCHKAGIRPVMITGDHPLTARAIARRLGILEEDGIVVTGAELAAMSLEEFEREVEHVVVYARVAPEQKLKIVRALQDRGQFVAMTGDGVNDSPALKRADIGIAMGITGTDVAKEASSMILLDDNFATIVKSIKEGRRIYDNILKFLKYSMTGNAGTLWAIFLAPLFGLPLPMLPIQILWMNLLCDSLPGLALTVEPADKDVMVRSPRRPDEGVLEQGRGLFIFGYGLAIGLAALLLQAYAIRNGMPWQTMVFSMLLIGRMSVAMAVRSERDSLIRIGLFSNKPLMGAVLLTIGLQLAVIYAPFLNPVFKTQPLGSAELGLTLALSLFALVVIEIGKSFVRRKGLRVNPQ